MWGERMEGKEDLGSGEVVSFRVRGEGESERRARERGEGRNETDQKTFFSKGGEGEKWIRVRRHGADNSERGERARNLPKSHRRRLARVAALLTNFSCSSLCASGHDSLKSKFQWYQLTCI